MIWYSLKQYNDDKENPDNAKEREKLMSKKNAKKPTMKMSIQAMAHWHSVGLYDIMGPKREIDNGTKRI